MEASQDIHAITTQYVIENLNIVAEKGELSQEILSVLEQLDSERAKYEHKSPLPGVIQPPPRLTNREFVMESRAQSLSDCLAYLESHALCVLQGMAGMGKTTLARALIELRQPEVPMPFWYDFESARDDVFGDIIEKIAVYLGRADLAAFKTEKREIIHDDIFRIINALGQLDCAWLIFDNVEKILDEHQRFPAHPTSEVALSSLFQAFDKYSHNAKVILTTRDFPKLADGSDLLSDINDTAIVLSGLDLPYGIAFLRGYGLGDIDDKKLESLVKDVGGHPLCLELLLKLVQRLGPDEVLEDLQVWSKERKSQLIARGLFDMLLGDERDFLEKISVFMEPVSRGALKHMGPNKKLSNRYIDVLVNKSLVRRSDGMYWLHPLVKDFAHKDLHKKKEAHQRAAEHYLSLPVPKNPSSRRDLAPKLSAFDHLLESHNLEQAARVITDISYELLGWGNYALLASLYSQLLGDASIPKSLHGRCFLYSGICWQNLGDVKKALEHHEEALRIFMEIGDRWGESAALGDLAQDLIGLGDAKKALEYSERSFQVANETGNPNNMQNSLVSLGINHRELGDHKKALEYHEQALQLCKKVGSRKREGICLGNIGLELCDLGEPKRAIDYHEQALVVARELGDPRSQGIDLLNLGIAHRDLGDAKGALEHYERSLAIFREIGFRRGEGTCLDRMGQAWGDFRDLDKSIEYHEQALQTFVNIEDRRGEGRCLSSLGQVWEALGDATKALAYREQAEAIFEDIGGRPDTFRSKTE